MNSEQELINRIKSLKNVKPNQEWVILAKQRIMGWEAAETKISFAGFVRNFIYQYRSGFAALLLAGIAGGTMAAAQGALPGEALYSVKKATERGLAMIAGKDRVPAMNLELAQKRLEEINQITRRNMAKNLPAAFKEYKIAKSAVKKDVAAEIKQNPAQAAAIVKQVGLAMQNIDTKERQVYGVLGLESNATSTDEDLTSDKEIVASLIEYFGKETILSEDQVADLEKVRQAYDRGDYPGAMNYYLSSSLNK